MKPVSLESKITVKENKKSQPPVRFQDILMSDQLHCSIYLTPFLHSFRVIMKKLYFQVYICSILANNALTSSEVSSRTITEGKECSQCKQNKKKKQLETVCKLQISIYVIHIHLVPLLRFFYGNMITSKSFLIPLIIMEI